MSQLPQKKPVIIVTKMAMAKNKGNHFQKYLCVNRNTGEKTCAILFPNGKVFVGDDVWRLSNKADCCEYNYRYFYNRKEAEKEYEFINSSTPYKVCWERKE